MGQGCSRRASPHSGARHQTGRAQVGDTFRRVPASGGGDGGSTSSASILFGFTADTFILRASPSLQTGGGACGHPAAPLARPGAFSSALYREGRRTRSEGREGANGDGNEIGGGDGNGDEDGDAVGTGGGDGRRNTRQ